MANVSFERELQLATKALEPQEIAKELAKFARQQLKEAQAHGEAPEDYDIYVNGRLGLSEDEVIPPGPILYVFNNLTEIVTYGVLFWRARGPKKSGAYARSVIVMVNGVEVRSYKNIPQDAEVLILATVPYTRKIEVGAMRMNVPPGIAEDTSRAIRAKYGATTLLVQRTFVNLADGYVLRRGRNRGKKLTYPAVLIRNRD